MSVLNSKLELLTAVLCDDIRREDNGKEILIGVYSGDIVVQTIPIALIMALWIPIVSRSEEAANVSLRIIGENGNLIYHSPQFTAKLSAQNANGSLGVGGIPMNITDQGLVRVQVKLDNGDWEQLKQINVRVAVVNRSGGLG